MFNGITKELVIMATRTSVKKLKDYNESIRNTPQPGDKARRLRDLINSCSSNSTEKFDNLMAQMFSIVIEETIVLHPPVPEKFLPIPMTAIMCVKKTTYLKKDNIYLFNYKGAFIDIDGKGLGSDIMHDDKNWRFATEEEIEKIFKGG
jgi:hypothetical protein